MKFSLLVKMIFASAVAFALSYVCYQASGDTLKLTQFSQIWSHHKEKLFYRTFDEIVSFNNINGIEIDSETTPVYIRHSHQQEGKVALTTGLDQRHAFRIERSNGVLRVSVINLSRYPDSALTILIPDKVKVVKVDNQSGDVALDHVNINDLKVKTVSGDITMDAVNAAASTIKTVSGDVNWKGDIKKLVLATVSGDVNINSSLSLPIYDIKTVSGDVNLNVNNAIQVKLDVQSQSGEVVLSGPVSLPKKSEKNGVIKIRSMSGDVNVS